jgi:hypothetical protein
MFAHQVLLQYRIAVHCALPMEMNKEAAKDRPRMRLAAASNAKMHQTTVDDR